MMYSLESMPFTVPFFFSECESNVSRMYGYIMDMDTKGYKYGYKRKKRAWDGLR